MLHRALFAFAGLMAAVMAAPAVASPIAIVDQQNASENATASSFELFQTFTPTLTAVDAVELWLGVDTGSNPSASVTVRLYSGAGSGGTELGASAAQNVTNAGFALYHFDFLSAITLTPGDLYTLAATGEDASDVFIAQRHDGNPYAGGALVASDGGTLFGGTSDLRFAEGLHAVPEPGALGLLGLGLIGLGLAGLGARRRAG